MKKDNYRGSAADGDNVGIQLRLSVGIGVCSRDSFSPSLAVSPALSDLGDRLEVCIEGRCRLMQVDAGCPSVLLGRPALSFSGAPLRGAELSLLSEQ